MTTPLKRSPMYEQTVRLGATFSERDGWLVPENISAIDHALVSAQQHVILVDASAYGKLAVEGKHSATMLSSVWSIPELKIGEGVDMVYGVVYRLRQDLHFIHTRPGAVDAAMAALIQAGDASPDLLTITDISQGRAELRLIGPESAELLSRLCGLDFEPLQFPNLSARQTSVAKTSQLILRNDVDGLPAYSVIGARSLGAYLWDTVMTAGREFGLLAAGTAALTSLEHH